MINKAIKQCYRPLYMNSVCENSALIIMYVPVYIINRLQVLFIYTSVRKSYIENWYILMNNSQKMYIIISYFRLRFKGPTL